MCHGSKALIHAPKGESNRGEETGAGGAEKADAQGLGPVPPGEVAPEHLHEVFGFVNHRITLDRRLSKTFVEIWEIGLYKGAVRAELRRAYAEWI